MGMGRTPLGSCYSFRLQEDVKRLTWALPTTQEILEQKFAKVAKKKTTFPLLPSLPSVHIFSLFVDKALMSHA